MDSLRSEPERRRSLSARIASSGAPRGRAPGAVRKCRSDTAVDREGRCVRLADAPDSGPILALRRTDRIRTSMASEGMSGYSTTHARAGVISTESQVLETWPPIRSAPFAGAPPGPPPRCRRHSGVRLDSVALQNAKVLLDFLTRRTSQPFHVLSVGGLEDQCTSGQGLVTPDQSLGE